jgi:uncharacterized protein
MSHETVDLEALEHAARSGDARAQHNLAQELEAGREAPCDFAAALHWYELAVKNRAPAWELAAERAARYHREGLATAQDWGRALALFEESARAYAYARFDVAWCYYWGLGTAPDPQRSAQLLLDTWQRYQYAENSQLAAQFALGVGVAKDMAQCIHWLRETRTSQGRLLLGHALGKGEEAASVLGPLAPLFAEVETPVADIAAHYWKRWVAAWEGDAQAQRVMANYELRLAGGDPADSPSRMRWLRLAADAGVAPAQHDLAECFRYRHSGSSLTAPPLVRYWRVRAAMQRHEESIRALAEDHDGSL